MPDTTQTWPTADARDVCSCVQQAGARMLRRRLAPWGIGGALAALAIAFACRAAALSFPASIALITLTAVIVILIGTWPLVRSRTPLSIAAEFERAHLDCDNLVVTTVGLMAPAGPGSALAPAVAEAARARLGGFDVRSVDDGRASLAAAAVVIGVAFAVVAAPRDHAVLPGAGAPGLVVVEDAGIDLVRVEVTPPPHLGREFESLENPASLEVHAGSRVTLRVTSLAHRLELVAPDGTTHAFDGPAPAWMSLTQAVDAGTVWTIRAVGADGGTIDERLLPLRVIEDHAPRVRVTAPAADQVLPDAGARVVVEVEAADDHGLARLALRYTRVTGSGETFTFTEDEMPVAFERRSAREWRGTATLDLAALGLEMGDTLVYRAAARDARPGATDTLSDSFLIEIGGVGGAAGGGFTLPEDEHRHAISQQMLIVKTEALQGARPTLTAEAFLEEAHHLSAEQRMVRAEFVFMTGGHVHDEVEEAEASHELAEGRYENEAMVEMLAATSHMSRAERLLIDGNLVEALVAERLALGALQRAFDRRRYFLRTTPERSRIELDRRLSGAGDEARAWVREAAATDATPDALDAIVEALRRVDAARVDGSRPLTEVARAVAALDPGAPDVQEVVVRLAGATNGAARDEALAAAAGLLRARASRWMAPATEVPAVDDPALGRLRDVLGGRRP